MLLLVVAIGASAGIGLGLLATGDDTRSASELSPAQGPFRGNRLPQGLAGRRGLAFALGEADGGRVRTSDLAGKPYLVTFLFTECPDVCPLIAEEIRDALRRLGREAGEVAVLAVSVDPAGDTPEAVRVFQRRHRLPPNFHYLIGKEAELKPVWDAYFAAPQIPGRAESSHTASVWLVDARGRIRTKYSGGAPVDPADLAHDLRILLRERSPSSSG